MSADLFGCTERRRNFSGMMRIIVKDPHPVYISFCLKSALYADKIRQRCGNCPKRQSVVQSDRHCRQSVSYIMGAGDLKRNASEYPSASAYIKNNASVLIPFIDRAVCG